MLQALFGLPLLLGLAAAAQAQVVTDLVQMRNATKSIAEFGNHKDNGGVRVVVEIGDGMSLQGYARTINYTVGGSADRGDGKDYTIDGCTSSTCSVRLPANRHSAVITINVNDDGIDEGNETIELTLKDGNGYTVNDAKKTTTVTINDDDTRGLTFHRRWPDVPEGGSRTYTVKLKSQPTEPVEVSIASNNPDVTTNPTSLLFNPTSAVRWDTAQTVTVHAAHDSDAEDDEATLTHTTSGGDYGGANALSIGRPVSVDDDDPRTTTPGPQLPRISLTGGADVTEGGTASFTVNADQAPTARLTVNVEVTERQGQDFVAGNQEGVRTVTLNAGATSTTFTVPTVNDGTDEDDGYVEAFVNDGTGYTAGGGSAVRVLDNDDPIPGAFFRSASSDAVEHGGTHDVQVELDYPAPSGGLTLRYSLSGTATAGGGNDFTIQNSGTVSIAAGGVSATIPVAINDDSSKENAETVVLTLIGGTGYTVGGPSAHTLTIEDNDSTSASFSTGASSADEDAGTHNVTVQLSQAAPAGGLTINYSVAGTATAGGGNDFTIASSGSLSIAQGSSSAEIAVAINDDSAEEAAEIVILTLTGGTGYTLGSPTTHTLTIAENDRPPIFASSLAILGGSPLPEGAGFGTNIQLNRSLRPDEMATLPLIIGGTATRGTDYRLSCVSQERQVFFTCSGLAGNNPTITLNGAFLHDRTSNRATGPLYLEALEDNAAESNETVVLALGVGGRPLTVTITDAPSSATVSFTHNTFSVNESLEFQPVITLSAPMGRDLTIPLIFTDITATSGSDYTPITQAVLEATGQNPQSPVNIAITDDSIYEGDETFTVAIDTANLPTGVTAGATTTATVTIVDNDVANAASFAAGASSAAEDAGTHNVAVNLSSTAPPGGRTLSYSVGGTATAGGGNDFTIQGSGTVTIAAGATSATIPVAINDDSTEESAETVILTLTSSADYGLGSTTVHTVTITDNDDTSPPTASVASGSSSATGNDQPETVNPAGSPIIRSSIPASGYYEAGDTITIEIPMDPAVTFTSRPELILDLEEGGTSRITANEATGTPQTKLTFNYRVQSGDEDLDGISAQLAGSLTVADGRRVSVGSLNLPSSVRIDARAPELALDGVEISSNPGADDTYVVDDDIAIRVEFTEAVKRRSTADEPSVELDIGGRTRTARLHSPNATTASDTWTFRYTVVAGDDDADGISVAAISATSLGATLEDAAGHELAGGPLNALPDDDEHKVDTQGPSITDIQVTPPGEAGVFVEGDAVTVTVTYDEEVEVSPRGSSAPQLALMIGSKAVTARYASGDGDDELVFAYTVVEGDTGTVSVGDGAITGAVYDAGGNAATNTTATGFNAYVDAAAPMAGRPRIVSSPPESAGAYGTGDVIAIEVPFGEPVIVTETERGPRVRLMIGETLRGAQYVSGSGSAMLRFEYTVKAGDADDDGIAVSNNGKSWLEFAGSDIEDRFGHPVVTSAQAYDFPQHRVDGIAPSITGVALTSMPASGDAYLEGELVEVTLRFTEAIAVSDAPTLTLTVGSAGRVAACARGGEAATLLCAYTVVSGDVDADGVSVSAGSLAGGRVADLVGNAAERGHGALADDPGHKVLPLPTAVGSIASMRLAAGGQTQAVELTGVFSGGLLTYGASSSNASVASAGVSGTTLTVRPAAEGSATITVTATNVAGSAETMFAVTVTTDAVEKAVLNDALAGIGRSLLSSTANVIGARFALAPSGASMAVGGQRVAPEAFAGDLASLWHGDEYGRADHEVDLSHGALTSDCLLGGTSFHMPLTAMTLGGMDIAVWGAGDLSRFEGEPDRGAYDGSAAAGYVGVDARGAGWLAGMSVSLHGSEADYDFAGQVDGGGTLETSVTGFHPYARIDVGSDAEAWVIGGFGSGEADLSRTHVGGMTQSSDLSMAIAIGGLQRALALRFGGAVLSLRGDAGFLSLETDSGSQAVDGLSVSVNRLRVGVEAAWENAGMAPFVEVAGRFDGGDGQTGGGIELAGGLRIVRPESGFGLEAKGRILAMHSGEGYSESGLSVTASFEPGTAGRGITFRLSPRYGSSADATDLFWDEQSQLRDAVRYGFRARADTWGMDAALGYGLDMRSIPGLVTPFSQFDVTGDSEQRIRVGVRYGLLRGLLGGTQFELSAEHVAGAMVRAPETRVLFSAQARF